ncbi:MAG: hypothetical protein J6W05_03375 [Prevotella sp.]|nr:hypothetical protein [Prevotella sp.]
MRKYLLLTILLSGLTLGARGQSDPEIDLSGLPEKTTASSLRYWFDTDANSVKTASISGSATTIDASALKEGIHTVHYQIVDSKNIAGIPASKMFIKIDPKTTATAKSLRYWFDTDADNVQTSNTLNGAATINASALKEGIHTVHYQIVDSKGIAGIPVSGMFIKVDPKTIATAKKLRYWFDTDAASVTTIETLSGTTTIDASALKEGIHTVHYQIVDNKNIAGIPVSGMFIKIDPKTIATANKLRYWFDTNKASVVETALSEGVQTIDASKLMEGIHTLHYQIVDSKGAVDIPVSALFIKLDKKTVAEATAIRYWFDENDANMVQVDIKETMTINVGKLRKGEHYLHMQLIAANGEVMPSRSGSFEMVTKIVRGDANDDEAINVADIVMIVNYIEDPENPAENFNADNADANDDGVVNADDIVETTYISMNGKSSWTKVGTGTFSYVLFWPSDYVDGVPQPRLVEGYELYHREGTDLYKIAKWGNGTPVSYYFTWDKETNVIATQKGPIGENDMLVWDVSTFNSSNYPYENYPSRYVPGEKTFYFYNVYLYASGSYLGIRAIPETFVVEWDVAN